MAMSQKAPNGEHSFWERFFLSPIVLFLLRLFFLTHSQLRTLKAEVEGFHANSKWTWKNKSVPIQRIGWVLSSQALQRTSLQEYECSLRRSCVFQTV